MILTLSGRLAAGCVKCAQGLSDRDLFTWTPHMLCSVWAQVFAEQPKNTQFPVAISFYLWTFCSDRDVSLSDMGATFFVLGGVTAFSPCAVSQQCSGVADFGSLNHSPIGHM